MYSIVLIVHRNNLIIYGRGQIYILTLKFLINPLYAHKHNNTIKLYFEKFDDNFNATKILNINNLQFLHFVKLLEIKLIKSTKYSIKQINISSNNFIVQFTNFYIYIINRVQNLTLVLLRHSYFNLNQSISNTTTLILESFYLFI